MTINKPSITVNILRQQAIAESVEQRVLIVGQKLNGGAVASGSLVENVPASNLDIAVLFGAKSICAEMVRQFKAINEVTALDVIAIDDNPGGTAASTPIAFTGTATENGRLTFGIGSDTTYRFPVDILTGDTAAIVAGKLESLVDASGLAPFTAALNVATTDLTAANLGTVANDWTVFVEGSVAGIAVSISAWSGGATDPVLTNIFAAIESRRYQTIVWPGNLGDAVVADLLDARFNVTNNILQGIGVVTKVGTAAEAIATATALNSQSMVAIGSKGISTTDLVGSAHREFPDVISTRFAAVRARRFTDDASLTDLLTSPAPLDQFGGRALASLPYHNTIVPNMPVIRAVDQWTAAELATFESSGVSVIGANPNFSAMILGDVVTTNTTDLAANPDDSFVFLNTVDTASAIRDAYFLNFRRRFAQSRLTDGALLPGRDLANKASIEAFMDEIHQSLAEDALVQAGEEAANDNKLNRVVVVDVAAGKVTFAIAPLLVTGVRIIIGTVTVNFGS